MTSLFASKKGQFSNYMAVLIFLLVFGFVTIFSYVFMSVQKTAYENAGLYTGPLASTGENFLRGLASFDFVIILVMVILIIGVIITSFKLATAPIFFIITLVMGPVFAFIAYFFSYVFQQMVSPAIFSNAVAVFPNTLIICTNLHWVGMVLMIVGSIALYAKRPQGQFV